MRESRYFFLSYAEKVGVRYPLYKKWGYAYGEKDVRVRIGKATAVFGKK